MSTEDAKLVTLARASRARVRAAQGAAVRDADGRTYAAVSVALASLQLSALQVCVAMAVASGARGLEAAVLLTDPAAPSELSSDDRRALNDFVRSDLTGTGVLVHLGDPKGSISMTTTT